jgi:hypothetical protein
MGETWVLYIQKEVMFFRIMENTQKNKIHDLFYAGIKMSKESSCCRSGGGGRSYRTELNWLIRIDTNMQKNRFAEE